MPVVTERSKIKQRDSVIKSGHSRSSLEDILSKPVVLDLLSVDRGAKTVEKLVSLSWKVALLFKLGK